MMTPDPVTAFRRRVVLLHVPVVAVSAGLLHVAYSPVNGLTVVSLVALCTFLVVLTRDAETTREAVARTAEEAAL